MRYVYTILIKTSKGKKLFGRSRHKLENNTFMDLKENGFDGMNRIQLAQDKVQGEIFVNTAMNRNHYAFQERPCTWSLVLHNTVILKNVLKIITHLLYNLT
jgi:hypothetical protein